VAEAVAIQDKEKQQRITQAQRNSEAAEGGNGSFSVQRTDDDTRNEFH